MVNVECALRVSFSTVFQILAMYLVLYQHCPKINAKTAWILHRTIKRRCNRRQNYWINPLLLFGLQESRYVSETKNSRTKKFKIFKNVNKII